MIMRSVAAAALLFIATVAIADEASKASKLKELMKAQGMYEIIEQEKRLGSEQARAAALRVYEDFKTSFSTPTASQKKALDDAFQKFLQSSESSWTPEDAAQEWSALYGPGVSEADLDTILAFYKSPAGQKDVEASKKAMEPWARFFIDRTRAGIERATQAYRADLKAIIGEKAP